jgi:hypothetical protein
LNLPCKKSCKRAVCELAANCSKSAGARHRATPSGEIVILRAMRDGRHLAALLVVLGALALAVPTVALAGGSAGNNQYTNPFGGGTTSQPTTTTPPQTSSTSAPETTTSAPPPATSEAPGTATTSVVTASDPTATSEPTATAAVSPGGTTTGGKGLPRTGYAVWELAGFGLVMVAGGFVIRRRSRRA